MSKSLRDLYLRSSEILHNWQEVVLVFRYDSSFLLCESCKTSQRATAVTNICQSERVIWPTSNIFSPARPINSSDMGLLPVTHQPTQLRGKTLQVWSGSVWRSVGGNEAWIWRDGGGGGGGLDHQLIGDDVDRCRRLLATIVTRQRVTRKVCKAVVKMHIKYF